VHGINAWDLAGEFAAQQGLVITPDGEPGPVVDSLQHAGLVYWAMQRLKARGAEPAAGELEARLIAALEDLWA
jgi:hypothetical protein